MRWPSGMLPRRAEPRQSLPVTDDASLFSEVSGAAWPYALVEIAHPESRLPGRICISRESNPGHIDGNDVFCHQTTDASYLHEHLAVI